MPLRSGGNLSGVFNSGVLAAPANHGTFDYMPVSDDVLASVQRLKHALHDSQDARLSAAMRFPLRHHGVTTALVGARDVGELDRDLDSFEKALSPAEWDNLRHAILGK